MSRNEEKKNVLIVGAGPVGLAAALFLSSNPFVNVQIVDKLKKQNDISESKALLINPRTMAILQGYKTQQKIKELAITNFKMSLATPSWSVFQFSLHKDFSQRYPSSKGFYIYPQHGTERLLEEELLEKGVKVERGIQLQNLKNFDKHVQVKLSNQEKSKNYDIVLGADGARSAVRKFIGVKLEGQVVQSLLRVADYVVKGDPWREARLLIGNPEFCLYLPVKDNLIRLVTNFPDNQNFIQKNAGRQLELGNKVWSSEFQLKNMHVTTMNVGNVYLAGDSAHIHIPMGGRGMNLGIEDAFVFANLLKQNRLHQYNKLRMPVIKDFIAKVSNSVIITDEKPSWKKNLLPYFAKLGFWLARGKMLDFVGGVDHEIPFL